MTQFNVSLRDWSEAPLQLLPNKVNHGNRRADNRKLLIAKTANHDLRTLKMLFKSARRDGVVTEDSTEFLETVRREGVPRIKRPFRGVLAR